MKTLGIVGLIIFAIHPVLASSITVGGAGNPEDGNCLGFGCGQMYQQLYDSSQFPGVLHITGLTFFNRNYVPGLIASANYLITLSTTQMGTDNMSADFGQNFGADNEIFFSGAMGGELGPTREFTISGLPYTYDPSAGNLLLSVLVDIPGEDTSVYLDFTSNAAPNTFSRAYRFGPNGSYTGVHRNSGLVTRFEYDGFVPVPPAPSEPPMDSKLEAKLEELVEQRPVPPGDENPPTETPEAGTIWMMVLGVGAIGLVRRRQGRSA